MIKYIVAAVAVVGAALAGATAMTYADAAPAVRPCTTTELGVWVAFDQGQGAAGPDYWPLEFTNLGTRTCSLYGYPGVSATGRTGVQLGDAAGRDPGVKGTVLLGAGQTAHAVLRYSGGQVGSSSHVAYAELLRVYAPGQYEPDNALWDLPGLTATGRTYLWASPVEAGAGTIGNG